MKGGQKKQMEIAGKTIGDNGKMVNVYQCAFCEQRSTDEEFIRKCEIKCHHREEAFAGNL